MLTETKFYSLTENLVRCECQICSRVFYTIRPDQAKYCSHSCRQKAYVHRMKEMIDQETIDNSNTKTDMTEEVKLLMEAKSEVSELRMQLKMQERDLSELNNFKARALSAESKIAEISTEYDSLKLINDDTDALRDALTDAEATNRALLDDITELKWACLSLQAAGMPAIDGKIISMATVQKFFGKEYSPEKTFKIKVWGFELSHQAGSQEVLIKKL